jgi:hypothetical protein
MELINKILDTPASDKKDLMLAVYFSAITELEAEVLHVTGNRSIEIKSDLISHFKYKKEIIQALLKGLENG